MKIKGQRLLSGFEILVSLGFVCLILYRIDLSGIFPAVLHIKPLYLIPGLILLPLGQLICVIKWRYLARALGVQQRLRPMAELYFIGNFFNLFLPTVVGGDITRGLYLTSDSEKTRNSMLSVFVERGTGVISLLLLSSVVMLTPHGAALPSIIRFGFPAVTLGGLIFSWMLPWILVHTRTRMRSLIWRDLIVFWKEPQIGFVAVLYSMAFHSVLVLIHVCISEALGLRIPFPYHFITISLASLASLLPSFNGIGVRDAAYVYLLACIGIHPAAGLLFSVLWFLTLAASSGIGCIVYLFGGIRLIPRRTMVDHG